MGLNDGLPCVYICHGAPAAPGINTGIEDSNLLIPVRWFWLKDGSGESVEHRDRAHVRTMLYLEPIA